MKLLIIHNRYQSKNIGGEDIVYETELISLKEMLGSENVFSYEVSNDKINKLKLIFNVWFSYSHYNNIQNIIKKNDIDIVHVHNFYPLLTPSIFKAAKDLDVKVIHTLHNYRLWCIAGIFYRDGFGICEKCVGSKFSLNGILNKCYRKSFSQSLVAQLSFWFYNSTKVFDKVDCFFVLTNFQREKIISLGVDKKKIILKPNSINIGFKNKGKFKDGYIYVGRLEESKGIVVLLQAWKQLGSKYKLTIIGGGELEEDLKKQYRQENIVFKSKCSREETLNYISKSKYLIQPSLLYETFGLTMIEAMSSGVPVIGFNIGTRSDFIQDSTNGFLCIEEDLLKTIKKSYGYIDYGVLSKNASIKAMDFEDSYIIEKQIKIYETILERH